MHNYHLGTSDFLPFTPFPQTMQFPKTPSGENDDAKITSLSICMMQKCQRVADTAHFLQTLSIGFSCESICLGVELFFIIAPRKITQSIE